MKELTLGINASDEMMVDSKHLASAVGSGSLDVLSTPSLIALMEKAACKCLSEYLEENETTVGTLLEIQHLSATPRGMIVTAKAELTEINGREFTFEVSAFDNAGLIGKGIHKRFLVISSRFLEKTNSKLK